MPVSQNRLRKEILHIFAPGIRMKFSYGIQVLLLKGPRMKGGTPMPRMSKRKKREWALYLNARNRITYNSICKLCTRECKQSFRVAVIQCRKFKPENERKKRSAGNRDHKSK